MESTTKELFHRLSAPSFSSLTPLLLSCTFSNPSSFLSLLYFPTPSNSLIFSPVAKFSSALPLFLRTILYLFLVLHLSATMLSNLSHTANATQQIKDFLLFVSELLRYLARRNEVRISRADILHHNCGLGYQQGRNTWRHALPSVTDLIHLVVPAANGICTGLLVPVESSTRGRRYNFPSRCCCNGAPRQTALTQSTSESYQVSGRCSNYVVAVQFSRLPSFHRH